MNKWLKLIVMFFFGVFGVHKFIDGKKGIGTIYLFTFGLFLFGLMIDIVVQFLENIRVSVPVIKNIENFVSKFFGILFILFGIVGLFAGDFFLAIYIIFIGSALIRIFHSKKSSSHILVNSNEIIKNHYAPKPKNIDENQKRIDCITFNVSEILEEVLVGKMIKEEPAKKLIVDNYKKGSFYEEDNLINPKYDELMTPHYILVQLNEIKNGKKNQNRFYYGEDFIAESLKYNNQALEEAEFYPFNTYNPSFSSMNQHQKDWYLYWRKEFLNDNIVDTDLSYIFLFSYELINYSFNQRASFNISVLENLYNKYKTDFPKLDNYLPRWLGDLLSETNYYADIESGELKEDKLVNNLKSIGDLDKIPISVWRTHYLESKTALSNKQLNLFLGHQKSKNIFKKYMGLLAKYFKENNIDIINRWFDIREIKEKRPLFSGATTSLDRKHGTFRYKKYFSTEDFMHDSSEVTKLCYDLLFAPKGKTDVEYVLLKAENKEYDLPSDFIFGLFNKKNTSKTNIDTKDDVKLNCEPKEFEVDLNLINNRIEDIEIIQKKDSLRLDITDKDFINLFQNSILLKSTAKSFCIKKGKMLNAYITEINEKHFQILNKELILEEDENYILNIDRSDIDD